MTKRNVEQAVTKNRSDAEAAPDKIKQVEEPTAARIQPNAEAATAAIRDIDDSFGHIALEGLPNTRDLGGIPAASGKHIAPRRLLRSGSLTDATDADRAVLKDDFHLCKVIDLRTQQEQDEGPDHSEAFPDVSFVTIPLLGVETTGITRSSDPGKMHEMIKALGENPKAVMSSVYSQLVLDKASQEGFATFFDELLDGCDGTILWHCTAGKDRAGLAAAFTLTALGASHDDVLKDYLRTNAYMHADTRALEHALASFGLTDELKDGLKVLNSADESFLNAAFNAIKKNYGSVEAFFHDELGLDEAKIEVLRERYLE